MSKSATSLKMLIEALKPFADKLTELEEDGDVVYWEINIRLRDLRKARSVYQKYIGHIKSEQI
jgi:hypothetical protein